MRSSDEEQETSITSQHFESVTDIDQICDFVWAARQSSSIFNSFAKSLISSPDESVKVAAPPSSNSTALIVLPEPLSLQLTAPLPSLSSVFRFSHTPSTPTNNNMTALIPYQAPVEVILSTEPVSQEVVAKRPTSSSIRAYPLLHRLNPDLHRQYMALKVIYLCNSVRELQRAVRRNASIAKNKLYSAIIMSRVSNLYHTYATLHSDTSKTNNAVLSNTASVPALTEWDIDELLRKLRLDMRTKRRHAGDSETRDIDNEYKSAINEVQAWRSAVEGCSDSGVVAY